MTTNRFVMPLKAYLSGIKLLEGNLDYLEYLLREHTENFSPGAIRDLCYAFVALDQYRSYMVEDLSKSIVNNDNNVVLTQDDALTLQMYQEGMNDSLDSIRREHHIVLEKQ